MERPTSFDALRVMSDADLVAHARECHAQGEPGLETAKRCVALVFERHRPLIRAIVVSKTPIDMVDDLESAVYERFVESAIGRGLSERSNRNNPWAVISALFAGMFDDHTIEWLNKHGYLRWDQRCRGEAIIAALNGLIAHHR